jgi:hypothetical protein
MVPEEILFVGFDGAKYLVDWRDFERVQGRDAFARTVPGSDPNHLILTPADCVFLWSVGIGTANQPAY